MILSRIRILPQQRFDLEDLGAMLAGARSDEKYKVKQLFSNLNHIIGGFSVTGIGLKSATVNMSEGALILPQNTSDYSFFTTAPSDANVVIPDADLVDGARNYVEIELLTENNTPVTRAFWDPEANGGQGLEFNQIVDTITDLKVRFVVLPGGFSGSPDRIPLCIIDTDGTGVIKVILDQRPLFGRLGTPEDVDAEYEWSSNEEPPYTLSITSPSGTFQAGETVTFSSGATAEVATGGTTSISVRVPSGINMASGDSITGGTSGATGTVNTIYESFTGADKDLSDMKKIISAIQTEIKFLKGTRFWHQRQSNSLQGVTALLNSAIVGLTAGARYHWSGTVLTITDDNVSPAAADALARLKLFGKTQTVNLCRQDTQASTTGIALADGELLFVKLPGTGNRNYSGVGSGDSNYQVVSSDSYVVNDVNYWIAYREGSKVYIRGYGELMTGESAEISDPISTQILTFIGAVSEADSAPAYSSDVRGIANQSLTARLGVVTDAAGDSQEDRSAFFRSDNKITWSGTEIQFTSDIILNVLNRKTGGVKTATIEVASGPIELADEEIAYITIDRTLASENVTVSIGASLPAQTQSTKDIIVLAYRKDVGSDAFLHIPLHKQMLNPGQTVRLGESGGLEKYSQTLVSNGTNVPLTNLNLANRASAKVEYRVRRKIAADITPGGMNWDQRTAPTSTDNFAGITYGGGQFVAVGLDAIMTSPDGITWTDQTSPAVVFWNAVAYGAGKYVAVAENAVMTSPDGITWTSGTIPNGVWADIIYANGIFMAVGEDTDVFNIVTSPDGITWTGQTLPGISLLSSVAYGNGVFVVLDSEIPSNTFISTTGLGSWTEYSSPFNASGSYIRSIAFGNGLFIAGGDGSVIETSPDGINWTTVTYTGQTMGASFRSMHYTQGVYYAVSAQDANEKIVTSEDGINWYVQTVPAGTARFNGIASNGTSRVVVIGSYAGSPTSDYLVMSSDTDYVMIAEHELVESGSFRVTRRPFENTYRIGAFEFSEDDAGVEFNVDSSGQVSYTSSNLELQENADIQYTIVPTS